MIDTWIFDLDNTLYHPELKIIEAARERYIAFLENRLGYNHQEALIIHKMFQNNHGPEVFDFLERHKITSEELYESIRGIDIKHVPENPLLRSQLQSLSGRKLIFTNAPFFHAEALLDQLGVFDQFDYIYTIENAQYIPKPHVQTYERFIERFDINPKSSIMFEDSIYNLKPAFDKGMTTVYVDYHLMERTEKLNEPFVHHTTHCLMTFLTEFSKGVAA